MLKAMRIFLTIIVLGLIVLEAAVFVFYDRVLGEILIGFFFIAGVSVTRLYPSLPLFGTEE